jgi:hypothetical protein
MNRKATDEELLFAIDSGEYGDLGTFILDTDLEMIANEETRAVFKVAQEAIDKVLERFDKIEKSLPQVTPPPKLTLVN